MQTLGKHVKHRFKVGNRHIMASTRQIALHIFEAVSLLLQLLCQTSVTVLFHRNQSVHILLDFRAHPRGLNFELFSLLSVDY